MSKCGKTDCTPSQKCGVELKQDGNYIAPYVNGVPLEPIDLSSVVKSNETDTRLQLDAAGKRLLYTGEAAENGGVPDSILLRDVFELMTLDSLKDVDYQITENGNILVHDGTNWVAYTPPTGTPVVLLGIDADGNIVKSLASNPLPGSVEFPIGGMMVWSGFLATLPSNFRIADGTALSRTAYADLFNIIGTTYGNGNGTTTFNIPNHQGRVVVGYNASQAEFNGVGLTGGARTHTLTAAQMPSHSHTVNDPGHGHGLVGHNADGIFEDGNGVEWSSAFEQRSGGVTASKTGITLSNAGGGQAHNNLQPYISQHWVIRVI